MLTTCIACSVNGGWGDDILQTGTGVWVHTGRLKEHGGRVWVCDGKKQRHPNVAVGPVAFVSGAGPVRRTGTVISGVRMFPECSLNVP
jgi:hypothetical protein